MQAIADDKNAAVSAIAADKKNALDAISADRAAAVKAIADDRAAAESTIATGKDDAVSAITNQQTSAQDAIAADKDDALSAFHTERDAVLTAIEEKTDAQVARIPDVAQLSEQVAAMQETVIPRVDSIEGEQIVQNNRLDELESHPAIDPSVERRLENLEAAAQGYLYREDVNADESYEKRVENDVLPWATLDKIGGKTIVMNQLIGDTYPKTVDGEAYEQTIDDKAESVRIDKIGARTLVWNQKFRVNRASGGNIVGITMTRDDDKSFRLSGTATGTEYLTMITNTQSNTVLEFKIGHKYFVRNDGLAKVRWNGKFYTGIYSQVIDVQSISFPVFAPYFDEGDTYDGTVEYRPEFFDLTQMFGAGNEPSADEFRALFPDDYYPYCEPELRNFEAHEVVSKGANLCPGLVLGIGVNTSTGVEIPNANFATSDYIPIDGRKAIYTSGLTDKLTNLTLFYDANKQYIGRTGSSVLTEKAILYGAWLNNGASYNEEACYMRLTQYKLDTNTGTIEDADGLNVMVNQESESMEYVPYFRRTIDLSAMVKKYFPNGMKAAGTVHDEIDLENRKAIQRVGVFDFTGTYSVIKDGNYCMTVTASAFNPAIKPTPNSETVGNVICSDYVPYPFREVYHGDEREWTMRGRFIALRLYTTDNTTSTEVHVRCRNIYVTASDIMKYIPARNPVAYDMSMIIRKYFPEGMRSAGEVYDELDLEHGLAIQRIGAVDLGTLSWRLEKSSTVDVGWHFNANVPDIMSPSMNYVCADYGTYRILGLSKIVEQYNSAIDRILFRTATTGTTVYVLDSSLATVEEAKAGLSGVMLYYELATPIVTTISTEDMIDAAINVEPGGTLTFCNGDDNLRIPVPNQETFIVNLRGETK